MFLNFTQVSTLHLASEPRLSAYVSFQVQGVGSRGWRDVTTFFSGRAEDPLDRYTGPASRSGPPSVAFSPGVSGRQVCLAQGLRAHSAETPGALGVQRGTSAP